MARASDIGEPLDGGGGDGEPFDRLVGALADGVIGAAGGLAGTALMTGVLLLGSSAGVFSWTSMTMLGQPLGLVGMERSVTVGYLIFLFQGMVPWPLLFAAVKAYLPGDRDPVTGAVFATFLWTGFVGAFYTGQAGLVLAGYLAVTLVAHWLYGVGLGAVFDYFATRPESIV